jgi:glyoxylase-like metal-dependent hydrolase (beta-lactamase superfamily II)
VTTAHERYAAADASLRALAQPGEAVVAAGRCIDITDTGNMGTNSYLYVVVGEHAIHWAPVGGLTLAASVDLDRVTRFSERSDAHRYAIALDHGPIQRRWRRERAWLSADPDEFVDRTFTRTELLFSRRETDAAVALREQMERRGMRPAPYVAKRWFQALPYRDGVLRFNEPFVDPFLQSNIYLVRGRDRDLLVDSGLGLASLRDALGDLIERPIVAVATHRHFDHTGGLFEFDEIVVHRDDAEAVANAEGFASVVIEDYPPEEPSGYEAPETLLHALPAADFDAHAYAVRPVSPTTIVDEGDVIDLGDRRFTVLHLPGHTPGEIGLLDEATRDLFSGDAIYESGVLLDELPESDIPDYVRTMERLRDLDVEEIHGGHDGPFGRKRLLELVDEYLARRRPA